ncbi:pentapeptide repeat-containing protein [Chamaesiphon sp. OTE_75_metabat_556]|uniref:pentapeptide repeat-containing protein n=1 Tax=Chamaesiphon sp. OTE_75_metabat_556 TaxID=2964692 RepID=UPI00286BE4CE|nr:pentapeptide repeat-containing protein [Chamaesiphon sp. OTE_75_metabat_556]
MALTRKASEAGLKIVDEARRKKCYDKYASSWYGEAKVSKSTLEKFWRREEIRHENFDTICAAIEVDWQSVVDESDRDVDNPQQQRVNQADRFKGLKIAKQIHNWLVAVEYKLKEPYEVLEIDYCEWIIKIQDPVRRARVNHILIRGIASEAKLPELQALEASRKEQGAEGGWLIVNRRISPAVKTELDKDENQHLSCMTLDDLIDRDADFEPYLTWLEEEVIKRGIDRKYVSLACDKEEIDPVTQHSIATSKYGEAEGWIEGYIKQWLSDDSKEHVSILGEFGTGKTWFSFHYAWDCLQAYKEAKEQGLERPRLPLVIALRDYNKALKVESVLSDLFFNKHDIRLNSSVFDCLNQMGKLVIIFDGFDEMADKVDRQKMINNFWELARVVCPGSKVILTSRTEHFPHDRESRQLLNAELESSTAKLKWESPRFELLELAKFNEAQIRRVLTLEAEEKGLSTDIVEKVMVRAELLDLARRPVMTELIIEAMPEIEAGKPVDMSRIYYYAIVRKMDRDIKAERTFTSLADKLYFLCEIAWEMLSTERMKLNYREFPDRIRQIFPQLVTEAKDLDHWHYDMMGQTILIRNADGDYTPAHRSFLEFLVGYKFAAEAGVLKADFVAAVQQQTDCIDGDAMPKFYTWTGYLQAYVAAKSEGKKIARLEAFSPESSKYLHHTFGHEPLTKAVIDLIIPMLEPTNSQLLMNLIHRTRGKTEQETGWLGGNAATLLVKQNPAALDCENLSYTNMANSDLLRANLQRVDCTGATLSNSLFKSILPSTVLAITTSQDGNFFVTGHEDGNVRLWDTQNGQLIHIYSGHRSSVRSVAIAPDGDWLVSGSEDKTIKRWNVKTNQCLSTYSEHNGSVNTVAIVSNGDWLLSGSEDNTIKRWNVTTGKCIKIYIGHLRSVEALTISPDGSWFASGSGDNTLKRWETKTAKCLNTYNGHEYVIHTIVMAPDGTWLMSGSRDKTLKQWETKTAKCVYTYTGHQYRVRAVAISLDNSWLVSCSNDKMLKRWDLKTGKCLQTYTGHHESVKSVAIAPDNTWLLSGSKDNTLKRWDLNTSKCLFTYTGHHNSVETVAIAPDGSWFVSCSGDKTLKRWDTLIGNCLNTYEGHQKSVEAVAIDLSGSWFISASDDATLKRWDTFTGDCLNTYEGHKHRDNPDFNLSVKTVAIAPDGSWFVSGSGDQTVKRWDTLTGDCLYTYAPHQSSVYMVAIAPDSSWFVSGSVDQTFKRWDTFTGECLQAYPKQQDWVRGIAISNDSRYIISGGGHEIKIWDVETGECIRTISNKPCGGMRIGGAIGLTSGQIESLKALGAVDD